MWEPLRPRHQGGKGPPVMMSSMKYHLPRKQAEVLLGLAPPQLCNQLLLLPLVPLRWGLGPRHLKGKESALTLTGLVPAQRCTQTLECPGLCLPAPPHGWESPLIRPLSPAGLQHQALWVVLGLQLCSTLPLSLCPVLRPQLLVPPTLASVSWLPEPAASPALPPPASLRASFSCSASKNHERWCVC